MNGPLIVAIIIWIVLVGGLIGEVKEAYRRWQPSPPEPKP